MIAKVKDKTYIDVDSISYFELVYNKEGKKVGAHLVVNGAFFGITDVKMADRVAESFEWLHANSIYNMIEDTDNYRKKINP